eukprot:6990274-Lingulodinium_polyedra.AAC.1
MAVATVAPAAAAGQRGAPLMPQTTVMAPTLKQGAQSAARAARAYKAFKALEARPTGRSMWAM